MYVVFSSHKKRERKTKKKKKKKKRVTFLFSQLVSRKEEVHLDIHWIKGLPPNKEFRTELQFECLTSRKALEDGL